MKDIIYTQKKSGECGSYACLNALQRMGVDISEEKILSFGSMLSFSDMERTLVSKGLIKSLSPIVSPRRIYNYLKGGIPLVGLIYHNNFDSVRNPPHIQDFKGKMQHFICFIEDIEDRIKYVDQQSQRFGDKGHGYIMKDQLKGNTRIFKINL